MFSNKSSFGELAAIEGDDLQAAKKIQRVIFPANGFLRGIGKSRAGSALRALLVALPLLLPAKAVLSVTNPPVVYDAQAQKLLLEKVQNRKPLSESDRTAKTKVLDLLPEGETWGMLYSSPDIVIKYIDNADVFLIGILTTDIGLAKKEAEEWFLNHGFSQDAICNYPVQFYLSSHVAQSLRGKGVLFNPLAEGCKQDTTIRKSSAVTIERVFTIDGKNNAKTTFAPGDAIQYVELVKNHNNNSVTAAFAIRVTDQHGAGISTSEWKATLPPGLAGFYTPSALPADAPAGTYTFTVTVTYNGTSSKGQSQFNVESDRERPYVSKKPEGKAPHLIVLVHGCCTDEKGVKEWDELGTEIAKKIKRKEDWEIVAWGWTGGTPINVIDRFGRAYRNAIDESVRLSLAIAQAKHSYQHIHLIGHSSGARLIDLAAKRLANYYNERKRNDERPFIHLTFLDAYTPFGEGSETYGNLDAYPKHYAEHYVDTDGPPYTDTFLTHAYDFDITDWLGADKGDSLTFGQHQWPRHWYERSVTTPGFRCGFALSLEGGNNMIYDLPKQNPAGEPARKLKNGDCELGDLPRRASLILQPSPTPTSLVPRAAFGETTAVALPEQPMARY